MKYGRRELIQSHLDARRYINAAEPLRLDATSFTRALQRAFSVDFGELSNIPLSSDAWAPAYLFNLTREAFLAQDSGLLESGLLVKKLEGQGPSGHSLLESFGELGRKRAAVTAQALSLLLDITTTLWPDSPTQVTSDDLLRYGFDDRNRPDPMEYW
ncbi:hypothetical protein [Deinococcus soli (ex Cha et al. 2016)]|uniref:Uncharacterized protein n=1 Tax=Deinococcus soli (ex Cha et al. 2016) TaxID=1309411 RepID=A0AAE3XES8_9DEIO|nr:hypothetical protein [Deinococcus soli (ex Cha et al. 2016)]MDR6219629.1 hypothetical protein [Deinococcus soli (ex Cha et al. 2016)]MDR6329770.1 hypothetical protein [Deinococcus soli (ex Cha et al. 2016)]